MKLSIITINRNNADGLQKTIESVDSKNVAYLSNNYWYRTLRIAFCDIICKFVIRSNNGQECQPNICFERCINSVIMNAWNEHERKHSSIQMKIGMRVPCDN